MEKHIMLGVNGVNCCILTCLLPFDQLDLPTIASSDFVHDATDWCGCDRIERTMDIHGLKLTGKKIVLEKPIHFRGSDSDHGHEYPWVFTVREIHEVACETEEKTPACNASGFSINDFLRQYRKLRPGGTIPMNVTRPRVQCADGYSVSVQAGFCLYSSPRADADHYTKVELGYPSHVDDELLLYAENPNDPTNTVYGYVPVELVDRVIQKHGGITGADLSNDMAGDWK